MKQVLDFVKGAVTTKDLIPVLSHFRLENGRIQGGNGRISLDAPCDIGGASITVPGGKFVKAIEACESPVLAVTKKRLTISDGAFKVVLPLSEDVYPLSAPMGELASGDIFGPLKTLRQFVGDDASRPWACGVLLSDGYGYATNNVVMVRMKVDWKGPPVNLPSFAIDELLRINKAVQKTQVSDTSITFHYGDRWLRSQLFDTEWPDMGSFFTDNELPKVPTRLYSAVEKVVPFCSDPNYPVITLGPDGVSTADGDMKAEVSGMDLIESHFRAEPLLQVLSFASKMNFAAYPGPCEFTNIGASLRGVLMGVRV